MRERRKNESRQVSNVGSEKFVLEDFSNSKTLHDPKKMKSKKDKALHFSLSCKELPLKETGNLVTLKTRTRHGQIKGEQGQKSIQVIQEKYDEIKPNPTYISEKYLQSNRNTTELNQESNYNGFYTSTRRIETDRIESIWCVALAPVHLKGLDTIGKIFGKSKNTVRAWCNKGAPIAYDGNSYSTEYMSLFTWYLDYCNRQDKI